MERLGAPGLPAQRHGGSDRTLEAGELATEGWPELGSGIRQGLRGTARETNAIQRVLVEHGSSCQLGPQLYHDRDPDGHGHRNPARGVWEGGAIGTHKAPDGRTSRNTRNATAQCSEAGHAPPKTRIDEWPPDSTSGHWFIVGVAFL